jgi:hypothetical protein
MEASEPMGPSEPMEASEPMGPSEPMEASEPMERTAQVARILEEAERLHGEISRRTDGDDPEWPAFYAWWLVEWSDLPEALGHRPSRSRLVAELVGLDRQYRERPHDAAWSAFYAARLLAAAWDT